VVDRDHMGHWRPEDDGHAVQTLAVGGGVFGAMAYWNGYVYVSSDGDRLRQFSLTGGRLSPKAESATGGVSATPGLSANGVNDGIVWLLRSKVWNGMISLRSSMLMKRRMWLMNCITLSKGPDATGLG